MKILFILVVVVVIFFSCREKTIASFELISVEDKGEIADYNQEIELIYKNLQGILVKQNLYNKEEISLDKYNIGDIKIFEYYYDKFNKLIISKDFSYE